VRPYWKGYLKLALVSCPIALHAACSTAERIAFRQINKATGNRLRQQLIDEEIGTPVAPEHSGRGYEVAKGRYLIVEDAELEAIEIESTHTIEIDNFVPRCQIDQRFFDTPYYVTPNEPVAQEAFAVIREAMRNKGVVALGRLVLSKRERVIALEAYDKGLLGTTLRYPYEVRKAEDYFHDLPDFAIAADMRKLAELILDSKVAEFDPTSFRDRYEEALLANFRSKFCRPELSDCRNRNQLPRRALAGCTCLQGGVTMASSTSTHTIRDRRSMMRTFEHGGERARREQAREQYLETLSQRLSQRAGIALEQARAHVEDSRDQCAKAV
jgi:DNA end-binding protein Ku